MDNISELMSAAMMNDVTRLNTISHNLANANTIGFRSQGILVNKFDTQMLDQLSQGAAANSNSSTYVPNGNGKLKSTGNNLDVALQSSGYFVVTNGSGEELYTRNGKFSVDPKRNLVHSSGLLVHGASESIELATTNIVINAEGEIREGNSHIDTLKIVHLPEIDKIESIGYGLFRYAGSVENIESSDVKLKQKHLESSNVSAMEEMVKLMEVMRSFEAKQKIISNYDQMVNSLIREISF